MSKGVQFLMKKNKIDVIMGYGTLKAGKKVDVKDKDGKVTEYSADHIIMLLEHVHASCLLYLKTARKLSVTAKHLRSLSNLRK